MMTHGSLFSGIGGFDLAAEWMGWKNLFHCEWNEFGQKVLKYYWPDAELFTDITKSNFTKYANKIDILTGGFPCQPYSQAGKRLGKDDERHLWPEMLRVIQEVKPTYIVGENVRGLTNWNGGVVFEEVCVDLENCGYEVQPVLLPACAVNAPHRRDRVWFVAYSESRRRRKQSSEDSGRKNRRFDNDGEIWNASDSDSNSKRTSGKSGEIIKEWSIDNEFKKEWRTKTEQHIGLPTISPNVTDSSGRGISRYRRKGQGKQLQTTEPYKNNSQQFRRLDWEEFPTQPPVCGGDDGLSTKLDGITFSKWRNESIKGYGNAIVPQVALQIFKTIQQHENNKTKASANV